MAYDLDTLALFDESNFDAYDSGSDRYSAVLKAGLEQHGLELSDVLAVTQDMGLWAICKAGIFRASLRGIFKKRVEVDTLIPYSQIGSIGAEPSGPHTQRIVLTDFGGKTMARIDFSAGGMNNTPELAATHRNRVYRTLEHAAAGA
jgi:hypothetical protein